MKRWNWTVFAAVLLTCLIGAMGNESIKNIENSLIFGLMLGTIAGLTMAFITRKPKS